MHNPYQPSQRQPTPGAPNDASRQYVPPPPPPPPAPAAPQSHGIPLPPPPNRPHPSSAQAQMMPRTPVHPGHPHTWTWNRQGTYPPPPPSSGQVTTYNSSGQVAAYNPNAYFGFQSVPQSFPPPASFDGGQPLTSATYIPFGDSFGPGVGFPALVPAGDAQYDGLPEESFTDTRQTSSPPGLAHNTSVHQSPQQHQQQLNGGRPSQPDPLQAAGATWPLDRVIAWLTANAFSEEWLDTFRQLDLHGIQFLELGRGNSGKGNFSMMHYTIFPELAKHYHKTSGGFDSNRARDEGKRLRKLVRAIVDNGGFIAPKPTSATSANAANSATSATSATARRGSLLPPSGPSPELPAERAARLAGSSSAPSTAIDGEDSPGFQMPTPPASATTQRPTNVQGQPSGGTESAPPMERSRSAFAESALRQANDSFGAKRHSPSVSNDTPSSVSPVTASSRTESSRTTVEGSPQPGQPSHQAKSSDPSNRYYHRRGPSSGSMIPPNFNGASGANNDHRTSLGLTSGDARRNGHDQQRLSSFSVDHNRNNSLEGPPSAKEHRGFLDKFRRKPKKEDGAASTFEDMHLPSPSSPSSFRHFFPNAPYSKTSHNSSDTSLDRPVSTAATGDLDKHGGHSRLASRSDAPKKFVMLTPDGWNYRLVEVTGVDNVETFRGLVRYNLQIPDAKDLPLFMTSPGQKEHSEPLMDAQIVQCLHGADQLATLKIFVHTPGPIALSAFTNPLRSAVPSPFLPIMHPAGRPIDEETYKLLTAAQPPTATRVTRHDNRDPMQTPINKPDSTPVNGDIPKISATSESGRPYDLEAAAEEHRKEVERKQNLYHAKRRPNSVMAEGLNVSGIKRPGVIDFDAPRESPYEEKRDSLVPLRKPPPVPPDTSTVIKANSLSKRNTDALRRSWSERVDGHQHRRSWETGDAEAAKTKQARGDRANATSGVAALAAMSSMSATVGAPSGKLADGSQTLPLRSTTTGESKDVSSSSTISSPRSPGFTLSKGNVPFKVPNYVEGRSASPSEKTIRPLNFPSPQLGHDSSPKASPPLKNSSRLNRMSTRKSYGPNLDFKEHHVSFNNPRANREDASSGEDSDSDGGLFAVPLAGQKKATAKQRESDNESQTSTNTKRSKPALSLRTPRSSTGSLRKSVTFGNDQFHSPDQQDDATPKVEDPHRGTFGLSKDPDSAQPASWTPESPDETTKAFRRRSFISDVWADRPPAEQVAENLDEFFPNVDLDQPMVNPESPPSSPKTLKEAKAVVPNYGDGHQTQYPISSTDDSGNSDSDSADFRRRPAIPSMAQRNIRRSGGLGRTKSIRDVVKGVYEQPDSRHSSIAELPGPSRFSTLDSEKIMRRKSTKMFGAKIEQIKPPRGSRLIQLETIPQDLPIQQDTLSTIPRRQVTFKWVKGQLIGKGTFGRVYLGVNMTTGELLAVKQVEVNPRQAGQDKDKIKDMVKALDSEIDTMQNLEHVNIVQYLGCERKEYSISIFLEYISGGSVGSCLRKHGKFEEPVVSSLTRQTLNGLAYLHSMGILHRDLKADNILLTTDGTCKISDFGISKKTDDIYGNDAQNTMQGSVFWMAPEVVRSQGAGYSAKVDIWSLGCVVLEMFAGRRPWSKEEAIGAIYKLGSLNQAPPIPDDVSSNISPGALSFMLDCFTVDPVERPIAQTLLESTFTMVDPNYSFLDSDLYQKIMPQG